MKTFLSVYLVLFTLSAHAERPLISYMRELNSQVKGAARGTLVIHQEPTKDRITLTVHFNSTNNTSSVWHQQAIYEGKSCPTLENDINKDGYIDIDEAKAVVGEMILPLDADINSFRSGKGFYPVSHDGAYIYTRQASYEKMIKDMRVDEDFTFEERVVMIQGVKDETELPVTVGTDGKFKSSQTLPVACGIINKL